MGELTLRGYYLGSNVSYNVKKMTENGYLHQERSSHDRRSVRVKLTEKGLELSRALETMFGRHSEEVSSSVEAETLATANETLRGIARELVETIRKNVTIDWTLRENVRAQLRVIIKRILRKHGYPPDKQEKATQTVLEQAEARWEQAPGADSSQPVEGDASALDFQSILVKLQANARIERIDSERAARAPHP